MRSDIKPAVSAFQFRGPAAGVVPKGLATAALATWALWDEQRRRRFADILELEWYRGAWARAIRDVGFTPWADALQAAVDLESARIASSLDQSNIAIEQTVGFAHMVQRLAAVIGYVVNDDAQDRMLTSTCTAIDFAAVMST